MSRESRKEEIKGILAYMDATITAAARRRGALAPVRDSVLTVLYVIEYRRQRMRPNSLRSTNGTLSDDTSLSLRDAILATANHLSEARSE